MARSGGLSGLARRAFAASLFAFAAEAASGAAGAGAGDGEPRTAETRNGPVSATVTLSPAAPRLGDLMELVLTVHAEPGVRVEMPSFGDALGRFTIVDFTPSAQTGEGGASRSEQRYTLQAVMSGRHRVPQLRLEFTDERPGRGDGGTRELLTGEIAFEVASVLGTETGTAALRPARAPLPEHASSWLAIAWPWLAAVIVAIAGLVVLAALRRHREAPRHVRASAFERASRRLERLRGQGMPEGDGVDPWYVELSDIVRRYIEERFTLRAPELTTEEFLLEAGRSAELSPPHRSLLSDFLERCDRVKFARYSPGAEESREVLDVAARFLAESRADGGGGGDRPR